MDEDKPVPRPVIIKTEVFSPAINKLIMSDGSTLYGCSWPNCQVVAPKSNSIGAHHKVHTGKAAQRRRGKRHPIVSDTEWKKELLDLLDRVQSLVNKVDAYEEQREAELEDLRHRAEMYDTMKSLFESE